MRDILTRIKTYHAETRGYFDLSLKAVSDYWRAHRGDAEEPPETVRNKAGMHRIILEGGSIRFRTQGVQLDLGGFGKGYAVKRILPMLEEAGVSCALISFGESLIYGMGSHPYGDSWKIRIPAADPSKPLVYQLKNQALSISGNSLNNQKKFADSGHIVNPVTLSMARMEGLLSVKAADPERAEVLSTALFSAGPGVADELINDLPDMESHWVFN
jgi:thiamine biosynthesis lipoprotein